MITKCTATFYCLQCNCVTHASDILNLDAHFWVFLSQIKRYIHHTVFLTVTLAYFDRFFITFISLHS